MTKKSEIVTAYLNGTSMDDIMAMVVEVVSNTPGNKNLIMSQMIVSIGESIDDIEKGVTFLREANEWLVTKPLIYSCQKGHLTKTQSTLKNLDTNSPNTKYILGKAFREAVKGGHEDIVEFLIDSEFKNFIDVDFIDGKSLTGKPFAVTPLCIAIKNNDLNIVNKLVSNKADVNYQFSADADSMREYKDCGIFVEHITPTLIGEAKFYIGCPLDMACIIGNKQIIMLLLNNGAELINTNQEHYKKNYGEDIAKLLIQAEASNENKSTEIALSTQFIEACEKGDAKTSKLLLIKLIESFELVELYNILEDGFNAAIQHDNYELLAGILDPLIDKCELLAEILDFGQIQLHD